MTAQGTGPAGYHAVHLAPDRAREIVWAVIADYLRPYVRQEDHVVEIGAGYCQWINLVRAARRVAVDRWPEFAAHAAAGVEALVLDASTDLPTLGAGRFDVALASNVLEHFSADVADGVVRDLATLLKVGGRCIIVQPNFRYAYKHYFDDYTHRSIFTHVSLSNLLRAHGFHIEACLPRFLPYSMRETRWPIRPWIVRAYLRSPLKPLAGQMLIVARKG